MMASSSGASSGSATMLRNSSSEEDLQQVMDTRKRKRMLSNRESARRSRMKKQKHLDDLMGQLGQLSKENNEILTRMNVTSQLYMKIEAENSILRAQMAELSHRLSSLNEIIEHVNFSSSTFERREDSAVPGAVGQLGDDFFMNPWNNANFHLNQPIMDMIMY
uniref:BZIP domain-containing protein n=1 Tax=Salix viminalis TaxID=40686 RepID=A0A6N2LAA9_SALVM